MTMSAERPHSSAYTFGIEAEKRAARYLAELGYTVLFRRYRTRNGEIDIVALDGEQLVFVEVKARLHPKSEPESAIGTKKIAALVRAAHAYLHAIGEPERGFRLDIIAIHGNQLRHIKDLFEP